MPADTRSFVSLLVAWMACSTAAVAAVSTGAVRAFAILAVGLVAATTLRFSARWGAGSALAALAAFMVLAGVGATPVEALTGLDLRLRLLGSLGAGSALAADVLAAGAL